LRRPGSSAAKPAPPATLSAPMAKSTAKDRSSAAAADIRSMLQGTVASGATAATAGSPPIDVRPHGAPAALGAATRHPADAAMSRTIRKDLYNLDPRRIRSEGFYVRET